MRTVELEYQSDSARLFAPLAEQPWAVLLDSGSARTNGARYDIFAADPYLTLTTRGATTEIAGRDGVRSSGRDPLELLHENMGPVVAPHSHLPFTGGAIGYFSYDLGRRYERWPIQAEDDVGTPEVAVGLYDWAVVVDHRERRTWLVGQGRDPKTFAEWESLQALVSGRKVTAHAPLQVRSAVVSSLDRSSYDQAFATIKAHISAGDCYQVNLTQRFSVEVAGSGWSAYESLRAANPAPFSAYLNYPFAQVLSSSPERFLQLSDGRVVTQPIKGTRPRRQDPVQDAALATELKLSAKDKAENVMIVDLLRNDLGKNCEAGSVRATSLFDVESFANVHHLVSTVEGVPAPGCHAVDILRGCFPGGSITGAPKVRAMQIIEGCEPFRRGVYCGAIGYFGFDGRMDTNVAIRTMVRKDDRLYAWAGGGIVADSNADAEYQESLDKASGLLAVLSPAGFSAAV